MLRSRDIYGAYGSDQRGDGGGGGSARPQRLTRATPQLGAGPRHSARGGGGAGSRARGAAPSHRMMTPQAD